MKPKRTLGAFLLMTSLTAICFTRATAADPKPSAAPDGKAIRAAAEAFDRGSAKDVAALWTADGSLADDEGKILKGRPAIEEKYAAFFREFSGAKIEITIKSVEFPTPEVAVEDGFARVTSDLPGPPAASRYTAVHTLKGGKWLMASVRETLVDLPSNFAHLEDLQWLIGKWEAKSNDTAFEANFRWIANKSFIARDYTTRRGGLVVSTGTQIIGWDPQAGRLRSWSFDSAGGYGAGSWTSTPEGWRIQSVGVLADGTDTTSIDCLIQVADEDDVLGWRSMDRRVGDVDFPNTPEIVFDRVREKH